MYAVSSKGIILEKIDGEEPYNVLAICVGDLVKLSFDNGEITGGVVSFTDTSLTLNTSSKPYGTNIVKVEISLLDKIEVIEETEEELPNEETDVNEGGTKETPIEEENA